MTTANQATTALLTEHFRYTPLTLLDDIINTVNELVFRAINAIESGFAASSPESLGFKTPTSAQYASDEAAHDALLERKQSEIDAGIVQLESLLNAIVDKDFDKFEIYTLRNILALGHAEDGDLARWVRLEHYRDLKLEAGRGDGEPRTPESVLLVRRKMQESAKLNAMLKAEEARNEATLKQLRRLLGQDEAPAHHRTPDDTTSSVSPFAFLANSPHTSTSSQPLTQNLSYALAQLPALRDLLLQLRSSLNALPAARVDYDSVEGRRRGYVESQTRRALRRRGVDVDTQGQIGAAGTGRKVAQDEVRGLEQVVQALGGAERDDKMEE